MYILPNLKELLKIDLESHSHPKSKNKKGIFKRKKKTIPQLPLLSSCVTLEKSLTLSELIPVFANWGVARRSWWSEVVPAQR